MAFIPHQSTLAHQASRRVIASIAVVSLIVGLAAWWMQQMAYLKMATFEATLLSEDYQKRIHSEEQLWNYEFSLLEHEFDHFQFPDPRNLDNLKKLFSGHLASKVPLYVVILDAKGKMILFDRPLPFPLSDHFFPEEESGWFHAATANLLVHYQSKKIPLPDQTGGYLLVMIPVDNALLKHLTFGNTTLSLLWHGKSVVQSENEEHISIGENPCGIHHHGSILDLRECIPWGGDASKNPILVVHKRIHPLISLEALIVSMVGIFLAITLTIHILLGSWVWKMARRIVVLREFCHDYSQITRLTPFMLQDLEAAKHPPGDEISTVADSLALLAHGVEQRVAEQEAKEKQLVESENRLREITSTIADGVMVLDHQGLVTFLNPQGEELLGWSEKELLGKNSHEWVHHHRPDGSVMPEETCAIHQTVCSGVPARIYEDHFIRRDGSFLPVALASAPLLRNGQPAGAVITFQDMTEHMALEQEVWESQNRFRTLLHSISDAILLFNEQGDIILLNHSGTRMFGFEELGFLDRPAISLFSRNRRAIQWDSILGQLATDGIPLTLETVARRLDGEEFPVEVSLASWTRKGKRYFSAVIRDISERKLLEQRDLQAYIRRIAISALLEVALEPLTLKRKLEVAMDIIHTIPKMALQAKGSIMLLTEDGDLELIVERHLSAPLLEKCKRVPLGYCLCGRAAQSKELLFVDSVDARHDIIFDGIQPHGHYCVPILSHGQLLGVLNLYVAAGQAQDPEESAFLTTVANTLAGLIERGRVEEKIRHMANHDALTGLPNRALFHEHLDQELRRAQRGKRSLVIAFMDLDRFKQVNDTLGHEAGDILLKQVTQRLRQCLRDSDTLARLGGDEFTLILPEIDNPPDAGTVAEKIIAALQKPFLIFGQPCEIGVSIGMSCYPEQGTRAEELLQKADQAMYAVKNSGRNAFQFFRD
ncbi:MAG: diguanylate cyclase [Magnetococcales bacterium]|nr:diguanylate cyclase [Magnetococcales bacterium]